MQLFVGKAYRFFLGELLEALLPTLKLQAVEKAFQAVRVPWRHDEVAADDLLQQLALGAALIRRWRGFRG